MAVGSGPSMDQRSSGLGHLWLDFGFCPRQVSGVGRDSKPKDRIQNVILTFSDNSIATFSGRAVVEEGDARFITDIQFTQARDLPEGYEFETLEVKNGKED